MGVSTRDECQASGCWTSGYKGEGSSALRCLATTYSALILLSAYRAAPFSAPYRLPFLRAGKGQNRSVLRSGPVRNGVRQCSYIDAVSCRFSGEGHAKRPVFRRSYFRAGFSEHGTEYGSGEKVSVRNGERYGVVHQASLLSLLALLTCKKTANRSPMENVRMLTAIPLEKLNVCTERVSPSTNLRTISTVAPARRRLMAVLFRRCERRCS